MELSLVLAIFFGYFLHQISSQNYSGFDYEYYRKSVVKGPEVCAESGCVRGKYESGRRKPYEAFYGIPFAEPPVGKLRLENPVPYHGWSGYWDASYPKDVCYQKNYILPGEPIQGSEDCLYLNVYRPSTWSADKKLPVIVYIHGGYFVSFSGNPDQFGPEYFMDNGEVILVTFNYRLGVFGFLCSEDEAVKGNFGFKDQQLALQWVATNIASFNGDANSITLSGQNVGAISANLHMMNPISQALFHRVILMSGTALIPYTYPNYTQQFRWVAELAGLKNWETASTTKLAYQMKKLNAEVLLSVGLPPIAFGRCNEGDWEGAFSTEDPRVVWAEGRFAHKPILISENSYEGAVLSTITSNQTQLDALNQNIYGIIPIQMDFDPRYVFDVLKFYFGDKEIIDETNAQQYHQLFSDRTFRYPIITLVNQFLKYVDVEKNPVFVYEFGFESSQTFQKYPRTEGNLGVGHYDDQFYLFTMTYLFPIFEPDTPESRMSDIFVRTIVNFAARGEVKVWRTFKPCTVLTSTPFCDYQIFRRYRDLDPNQVIVSVSNEIDLEMVKLWSQIDNGVKAINLPPCSGGNCDC